MSDYTRNEWIQDNYTDDSSSLNFSSDSDDTQASAELIINFDEAPADSGKVDKSDSSRPIQIFSENVNIEINKTEQKNTDPIDVECKLKELDIDQTMTSKSDENLLPENSLNQKGLKFKGVEHIDDEKKQSPSLSSHESEWSTTAVDSEFSSLIRLNSGLSTPSETTDEGVDILLSLTPEEKTQLLRQLTAQERADLIHDLPSCVRKPFVKNLDAHDRIELLGDLVDSEGSLLHTSVNEENSSTNTEDEINIEISTSKDKNINIEVVRSEEEGINIEVKTSNHNEVNVEVIDLNEQDSISNGATHEKLMPPSKNEKSKIEKSNLFNTDSSDAKSSSLSEKSDNSAEKILTPHASFISSSERNIDLLSDKPASTSSRTSKSITENSKSSDSHKKSIDKKDEELVASEKVNIPANETSTTSNIISISNEKRDDHHSVKLNSPPIIVDTPSSSQISINGKSISENENSRNTKERRDTNLTDTSTCEIYIEANESFLYETSSNEKCIFAIDLEKSKADEFCDEGTCFLSDCEANGYCCTSQCRCSQNQMEEKYKKTNSISDNTQETLSFYCNSEEKDTTEENGITESTSIASSISSAPNITHTTSSSSQKKPISDALGVSDESYITIKKRDVDLAIETQKDRRIRNMDTQPESVGRSVGIINPNVKIDSDLLKLKNKKKNVTENDISDEYKNDDGSKNVTQPLPVYSPNKPNDEYKFNELKAGQLSPESKESEKTSKSHESKTSLQSSSPSTIKNNPSSHKNESHAGGFCTTSVRLDIEAGEIRGIGYTYTGKTLPLKKDGTVSKMVSFFEAIKKKHSDLKDEEKKKHKE
ncbi:hypothetical protein TCON_2379 [Astathelohania contejeani]|uniref:Tesmin/TSO1-like CXC domain-containing protein n=1 Tax=Astathelohania contejeani TaxID=164912 RepID=A0ABQ7HW57_9MICR|nr:hypothetical protein TCON_2379 [Thelohania contejeani]